MKFYLNRKIAQEEHRIYLHGIDLELRDIRKEYMIFDGDAIPSGYMGLIKVVDDTIVGATRYDAYIWGLCSLSEGEVVLNGQIHKMECPSPKYIWDKTKWIVDEELLEEGEYVEDNQIKSIEKPNDLFQWDKDSFQWLYKPEEYELGVGEIIKDNQIIKIPMPDGINFPFWNRETNTWEDKTPVRDLIAKLQNDLIDNEIRIIACERLDINTDELLQNKSKIQNDITELKAKLPTINVIGGNE